MRIAITTSRIRADLGPAWIVPVAVMAVLVGSVIPLVEPLLLLAVAAGVAVFLWILRAPERGVFALMAIAAAGWGPPLATVAGELDVYTIDILYALLVVAFALKRGSRSEESPRAIPLWPVGIFVALIGVSALFHSRSEPEIVVSWLRLVQTLSLAWLARGTLRDTSHYRALIGSFQFGATVGVIAALAQSLLFGGALTSRFGGFININTFGLVSALLLLSAIFSGVPRRTSARWLLVLLAAAGLLLSKSLGAGGALIAGIAVGLMVRYKGSIRKRARAVMAVAVVIPVLIVVLMTRSEVIPGSPEFGYSSAGHRLVLAAAGWEVFLRHPLLGVGWRRNATEAGILGGEVRAALSERVRGVNPLFVPGSAGSDITGGGVHNAYIQILSELGIIGFLLLLFALIGFVRNSRQGSLSERNPYVIVALVASLVWWNTSELYGGQPETLIFAIFLGAASILASQKTGGISEDAGDGEPPVTASSTHQPGVRFTGDTG